MAKNDAFASTSSEENVGKKGNDREDTEEDLCYTHLCEY